MRVPQFLMLRRSPDGFWNLRSPGDRMAVIRDLLDDVEIDLRAATD